MSAYEDFLARKAQLAGGDGFEPVWMPDFLFPFQRALAEYAVRQGRAALFADCGLGKAQPVDEPILTPNGWRAIGSLAVGDQVVTVDGTPTRVIGVHPQGVRPISRVTFDDGASTRCDDEHLWTVATDLDVSRGRPWRTYTLRELVSKGLTLPPRQGPQWRVPIVRAVLHPHADLSIDPYVMGVLLGDGTFRPPYGPQFSVADAEIAAEVKGRLPVGMRLSVKPDSTRTPTYMPVQCVRAGSGGRVNKYLAALRSWGLQGKLSCEKFIPIEYLTADTAQRLDLLRGLMDTDGYVSASGTVQFGSSSPELAQGVLALVRSLGGVARITSKTPTYMYLGERRIGRQHFTLTVAMPDGMVPFLLSRKVERCIDRYYVPQRKIKAAESLGAQECVCIRVEHPSQLYVTADYIVTHNTPLQLVWAENVRRKTGKPVLIVTPLAVSSQTQREAEKFGIEAAVSRDGGVPAAITVTNYERLENFDTDRFGGVVCDESSAIKAFDGQRRAIVTEFLRTRPYRLLCTATAAPNDYTELGTSSEALGQLGHMDMLNRFFTNRENNSATRGMYRGFAAPRAYAQPEWRFKGHAEDGFWRWVASWARACRRPSDLGFSNDGSRRTLTERCETAAARLADADSGVAWCHLNTEGTMLASLIDGAVEVSGSMSIEEKEERLLAFSAGQVRVLVTKPKLGAWGLNWQHCHRMTYFPSHSYEQYYQAVRRSWRFGQKHPVQVDLVTAEGGQRALDNLQRKSDQADAMFDRLVAHMNNALSVERSNPFTLPMEAPAWAT